ncbi:hypothetical protein HS088_TW18G00935 [Tripterygium wilfordii]|uniref:Uncharacterized protein n=1 Tax=Tripterygium wilfordii TaxID=458696 RepID=A0A7J7CDJ8_TRIWF|nr:hypothetical protein HS088_TW18G00935 [Tripterygium wilfordii]
MAECFYSCMACSCANNEACSLFSTFFYLKLHSLWLTTFLFLFCAEVVDQVWIPYFFHNHYCSVCLLDCHPFKIKSYQGKQKAALSITGAEFQIISFIVLSQESPLTSEHLWSIFNS